MYFIMCMTSRKMLYTCYSIYIACVSSCRLWEDTAGVYWLSLRAQAVCSQWGADPLARGAYSSIGVGANGGTDYDTMARAVAGRVFFAGEATTRRYPATMHGAFVSGLRAVRTCTMVRLPATWCACEGLLRVASLSNAGDVAVMCCAAPGRKANHVCRRSPAACCAHASAAARTASNQRVRMPCQQVPPTCRRAAWQQRCSARGMRCRRPRLQPPRQRPRGRRTRRLPTRERPRQRRQRRRGGAGSQMRRPWRMCGARSRWPGRSTRRGAFVLMLCFVCSPRVFCYVVQASGNPEQPMVWRD